MKQLWSISLALFAARLSPLYQALQDSTKFDICKLLYLEGVRVTCSIALSHAAPGDQSVPILRLLKALYTLNVHWTDLYPVSSPLPHPLISPPVPSGSTSYPSPLNTHFQPSFGASYSPSKLSPSSFSIPSSLTLLFLYPFLFNPPLSLSLPL